MATIIVQYGAYFCGECFGDLRAEWTAERYPAFTIVACHNSRCERKGLRLKLKLQTIEVEELHDA